MVDTDEARAPRRRYLPRQVLATALMAKQDWPAARAELEEVLRRQPDLVQAFYSLGLARYALGDLNGAIEAYRQRPLIVYATSTRPRLNAMMGADAVRDFIDQVDAIAAGTAGQ